MCFKCSAMKHFRFGIASSHPKTFLVSMAQTGGQFYMGSSENRVPSKKQWIIMIVLIEIVILGYTGLHHFWSVM